MHANEQFLRNLANMNTVVCAETRIGKKWRYKNSNQEDTFELARTKGNRVVNCVLGVRWGLNGVVPSAALHWYGAKNRIQWGDAKAEAEAKRYFDIINSGGKTVRALRRQGKLFPGDILTYTSITHTNAYVGDGKSFDTGHAYCIGQRFRKWIGNLSCKNYRVAYIFRLKDRAHYRVQTGAFYGNAALEEHRDRLKAAGIDYVLIQDNGMIKVQVGFFSSRENAEKLVSALRKKKIDAIIREV